MHKKLKNVRLFMATLLLCMGLSVPAAWGGSGSIKGTVVDSQGNGIYGITVNVYHQNHLLLGSITTDYDGLYTVDYLPADSYKVEFVYEQFPGITGITGYLGQWYSNKSDFASAPLVAVPPGATIYNINATPATGGSISGTVTGTTSPSGVAGTIITIYDAGDSVVGEVVTDSGGGYSYANLPTGSYKVRFSRDQQSCSTVAWYNAKNDSITATQVAVIAGQERTGINALLPTGKLLGTLLNADTGKPFTGFTTVAVYDAVTGNLSDNVYASFLAGTYLFSELAPGNYKIRVTPTSPQYPVTWYDNKYSMSSANSVTITGSSSLTANTTLSPGGTITGHVTEAVGGTGINGAAIHAYDSVTGEQRAATTTNSVGAYTLQGVPTGQSYQVQFTQPGYEGQWYNNTADQGSALPITVAAATPSVTGIDATLVNGCANTGGVTGLLLYPWGDPALDATVTGYDLSGRMVAETSTDADGTYRLTCLPSGGYKIVCDDIEYLYTATAAATVTAPAVSPLPNIIMGIGGSITGQVVNNSGETVAHADVAFFDAANNRVKFGVTTTGAVIDYVTTDIQGNYVAGGLPSGSYTVRAARNGCSGMENGWYGNQSPVVVTAPDGVTGITIALGAPPINPRLTLRIAGNGAGSVTSMPAGINCSSGTCTSSLPPGTVTLTPHSAEGSLFTGWSGGGCSKASSCEVTLTADTTVTATFYTPPVNRNVTVTIRGTGFGSVGSIPPGITCPMGSCSAPFPVTTPVTLTPAATIGSFFTGWSGGGCNGTAACVIPAGATTESNSATFTPAKVKMGLGYWLTMTEAYSGAMDGAIIQTEAQSFAESLNISRGIAFSVMGGYNDTFSAATGFSILQAPFIVSSGKVTLSSIVIR